MIHRTCKITLLALLAAFGLSAEPYQQQFSLQSEGELITWCLEKSSPFQSISFGNEEDRHAFIKLSLEQGEDPEEKMIQLLARCQVTEYPSNGPSVTREVQSSSVLIQETKPFVSADGFAGNSSVICITDEDGDEDWYKLTTFSRNGSGYVLITEIDSDWHEHPLIQEHEDVANSFRVSA